MLVSSENSDGKNSISSSSDEEDEYDFDLMGDDDFGEMDELPASGEQHFKSCFVLNRKLPIEHSMQRYIQHRLLSHH